MAATTKVARTLAKPKSNSLSLSNAVNCIRTEFISVAGTDATAIALIGAIQKRRFGCVRERVRLSAHTCHWARYRVRALDSNRNWHWNILYVVRSVIASFCVVEHSQCARRKRFRVRVRTYYVFVWCLRLSSQIWHRIWSCVRQETAEGARFRAHSVHVATVYALHSIQCWTEDWVISPVEWIFSEIVDTTRLAKNDDRRLRIVCILDKCICVHVAMTNQFGCVARSRMVCATDSSHTCATDWNETDARMLAEFGRLNGFRLLLSPSAFDSIAAHSRTQARVLRFQYAPSSEFVCVCQQGE